MLLTNTSTVVRATAFKFFLFWVLCMNPVSSLLAKSNAFGSDPDTSLLRSKGPTGVSANLIPAEGMM